MGKLLLCKGYVLTKDYQMESLLERGMFVEETIFKNPIPVQGVSSSAQSEKFNPFWLWDDINVKLTRCLRNIKQVMLRSQIQESIT